jgi:hypothetical protein
MRYEYVRKTERHIVLLAFVLPPCVVTASHDREAVINPHSEVVDVVSRS